ncbi:MAG: hypothetical protein Q8S33_13135 [Myxococcales bacterium]|nr:hypothetical protein [Myxococcales bacterium]
MTRGRLSPPDALDAPHPGFADPAFVTSLRTNLLPFLEARALVR